MSKQLPERLKAKDDSFAELFREARLEAGITFRVIAAHCGKTISYLSDVEHRRKHAPRLPIVAKIEECLGVTDGRLTAAARLERLEFAPIIRRAVRARPAVAELLENLDRISEKDLQSFLEVVLDKEKL